eukprot:Blabericola_migrator_1__127@NODE_1032_length_5647_cov_92_450000_g711_i0_p2_GENE_NODE_1032_length_5647_cov_92_450000_g711_i0NODE_1032_length_5647_cov_92_450000_g711_i0_p2_ORF_typecomplete_len460_score49_54Branch/PF02485_21/2_5e08_NODE_1032_length_5647_cov_92_450000_g711_i027674146
MAQHQRSIYSYWLPVLVCISLLTSGSLLRSIFDTKQLPHRAALRLELDQRVAAYETQKGSAIAYPENGPVPGVSLLFVSHNGELRHPTLWKAWFENAWAYLTTSRLEPATDDARRVYNAPENGSAILRPFFHYPLYIKRQWVLENLDPFFHNGVVNVSVPCTPKWPNLCIRNIMTYASHDAPQTMFMIIVSADAAPVKSFQTIYEALQQDSRSRMSIKHGVSVVEKAIRDIRQHQLTDAMDALTETVPLVSPYVVLTAKHARTLLSAYKAWAENKNFTNPFYPLLVRFQHKVLSQINFGTTLFPAVPVTGSCGGSWHLCCAEPLAVGRSRELGLIMEPFSHVYRSCGDFGEVNNGLLTSVRSAELELLTSDPSVWFIDGLHRQATVSECVSETCGIKNYLGDMLGISVPDATEDFVKWSLNGDMYEAGSWPALLGELTKVQHLNNGILEDLMPLINQTI